jgi:hypothetical protein
VQGKLNFLIPETKVLDGDALFSIGPIKLSYAVPRIGSCVPELPVCAILTF